MAASLMTEREVTAALSRALRPDGLHPNEFRPDGEAKQGDPDPLLAELEKVGKLLTELEEYRPFLAELRKQPRPLESPTCMERADTVAKNVLKLLIVPAVAYGSYYLANNYLNHR